MKKEKKVYFVKVSFLMVAFALMMAMSGAANASGTLDPRDAIPAPGGTNVLHAYYSLYTGSNYYVKGDKVDNNTSVRANMEAVRYSHWGNLGSIQNMRWYAGAIIPFGDKTLDGNLAKAYYGGPQSASGLADPTLILAFWPYTNYGNQFHVAIDCFITAPLGKYSNDKPVNMGNNRWAFMPGISVNKGFGPLTIQLNGEITYFTDNTNYTIAGLTQKRDLRYTVEGSVAYNITDKLVLGVQYNWYYGGKTKFGAATDWDDTTGQNDQELGVNLSYQITDTIGLNLGYDNMIKTWNGSDSTDQFRLVMTYRF